MENSAATKKKLPAIRTTMSKALNSARSLGQIVRLLDYAAAAP
jgi:hypothetical protein